MPANTDQDYRNWYAWKFDDEGNVRPGWSNANYVEWFWSGVKPFGTRNCRTVMNR